MFCSDAVFPKGDWTDCKDRAEIFGVRLEVYSGPEQGSVLEIIRRKLEADNMSDLFICYLLTRGKQPSYSTRINYLYH